MGSGSIAIACHYRGHPLTACEIDADYYAAAVERIQRETRQLSLFTDNEFFMNQWPEKERAEFCNLSSQFGPMFLTETDGKLEFTEGSAPSI